VLPQFREVLKVHMSSSPLAGLPIDADIIIVGAGPAGMAASVTLAQAGRKVIVLDMQARPGGQIFRGLEANLAAGTETRALMDALGQTYAAGAALIRTFRKTPGIDFRPCHTVWEVRRDGTVGWLHGNTAGYLRADQVVLANGAMERPMPFPGWTLPGVMTAGAVQTLLKAGRLKPGGRVVLAGTGPLIFLLAHQLRKLGVRVVLLARTDRLRDQIAAIPRLRFPALGSVAKGLGWLIGLRLARISVKGGVTGIEAWGQDRVEGVRVRQGDRSTEVTCDLLIVHDGIIPSIDLAKGAGLRIGWNDALQTWHPETTEDGTALPEGGASLTDGPCRILISGDARHIGGADAAIAHGRHVADVLLGCKGDGSQTLAKVRQSLVPRPFLDAAFPPGLSAGLPTGQTTVCRCEEVPASTLHGLIRAGAQDINQMRGLSRCGMGPCQGRSCAITLARMIAAETGAMPVPFRARPPDRPLPLQALASLSGVDPRLAEVVSLEDKPQVRAADV
jgi:NADPH-dependent 2,4-dienoyl-CoA reductase/sulfur reductase-like enzyme/bacterioferritin-associated ferredoxin